MKLIYIQVKEGELARVAAILVYKPTCEVAAKYGPEIVLRNLHVPLVLKLILTLKVETHSLQDCVEANLVQK